MTGLQSILVLVDSDMKDRRALARGIALARASGARLHVALIAHDRQIEAAALNLEVMRLAQRAFLQQRREWLQDRLAHSRIDGSHRSMEIIWSPHYVDSFLTLLRDINPDLVIKDATCGNALLPGLLTPLDWKLLRACPMPLMLLAADGPLLPQRMLAAVDTAGTVSDPEDLNREIVATAQSLAAIAGADLQLASAFPWLLSTEPMQPVVAEALDLAGHHHLVALDALRNATGIAADHCHQLRGATLPALNRHADSEEIDLVVLGSIYRRGFARLLLGSTSEEILQHLRRDVLLVKPLATRRELMAELGTAADQTNSSQPSARPVATRA